MTRYRYTGASEVLVVDLNGAVLQPGQEFDPSEFGAPEFVPSPYPHPLFDLVVSKSQASQPEAPQE